MADISASTWSVTDASNSSNSPTGWNSSTTPANVIAIMQATSGAIKRQYERLGPVLTSTGSGNAYVVTPGNTSFPVSLTQGDVYTFIANFANSSSATLAYNGLSATTLKKMGVSGPTNLTGGEIQIGQVVTVKYDGTFFQITSQLPAAVVSGYLPLAGGALTGAINLAQASNLASASTTNIGAAAGNYINITGTTTITAFDTVQAGTERVLNFNGILTLTYNATSLILPGKTNILTAVGDVGRFISLGSGNWVCVDYNPVSLSNSLLAQYLTVFAGGNITIGDITVNESAALGIRAPGLTALPLSVDNSSTGSGSQTSVSFVRNSSNVGSITTTNVATAFNTSSDKRLKTNFRPIPDVGELLDKLAVGEFDWKAGGKGTGVLAQDAILVIPEAVHQGDDGETIESQWAVDYSKYVPYLIAEIQSLRQRIAILETKETI